jgi:hypothetical protein
VVDVKPLLIALALCAGCLVLPKTTTTATKVGTEQGELVRGAVTHVSVRAVAHDGAVVIRATETRACARPVVNVYEVREQHGARYESPNDARVKLLAAVVAPVTLPATAIYTALVSWGDDVKRVTAVDHVEQLACDTDAAAHPIDLQLASGAPARVVTDNEGRASYAIPASEPYDGTIAVRDQVVEYHRPVPAVAAARDAVLACGEKYSVHGAVHMTADLDERGLVTQLHLDTGGPDFSECVAARLVGKRFPHAGAQLVWPLVLPGGTS